MHILLVEPDSILADVYSAALERDGHSVVAVRSAQAAVHAADERTPDVVLLELQLPRHNGVEFLYEFRSYSEWLHVPVVLHTDVPPQELTAAATLQRNLGVRDILHKPTTSLQRLCAAVQNVAAAPA